MGISFYITTLILALLPGIGVVYTISVGMTKGKKKSIYAAVGCTIGLVPHIVVSTMILVLFKDINPSIFEGIRVIGSIYLVYMGIDIIRSKNSISADENIRVNTGWSIALRGTLINLLNPKLIIFFISYIPQYVSNTNDHFVVKCIILGGVVMIITLIVFVFYGLLSGIIFEKIKKSQKGFIIVQRLFGLSFLAFAIKLLLDI